MKKLRDTIDLQEKLIIGKGNTRTVFQHPNDFNKCIKITFNFDRNRSIQREIRYLEKYWKQKKPFKAIPRCYGRIITTKGSGAVFDLIRDFDSNISMTLPAALGVTGEKHLAPERAVELLERLRKHLIEHGIIVCDPAPHNIVVQYIDRNTPQLVIIDGIGNPHFIKIADYIPSQAATIINKKWKKYMIQSADKLGLKYSI